MIWVRSGAKIAAVLEPVDRLEATIVVDTALDLLSTVPDSVRPEAGNIVRAGATEMDGRFLCCAAWGYSVLLALETRGRRRTLLLDAGPEAYAFERNATRLGLELGSVEAVALSHGHFDHAGGLPAALSLVRAGNGGRPVPVHVNPGMFTKRARRMPDGSVFPLGDVPSASVLEAAGGAVVSDEHARTLLDGTVLVSGPIPRLTSYERGLPNQLARADEGTWSPDPLILDERFVAVHVRGLGVVVFSSCSHAGIVNVLRSATDLFAPVPVHAAMGGLHLSGGPNEATIAPTVDDLRQLGLGRLVPSHCTGWRATTALVQALGDRVIPGAVGQTHLFG
jgi:7,8-dihydropterin-6-yl-methyl-4-(beta-D-ribofuranosyl)aminobenzene 5'-phosphate synthase